MQTTTKKWFRDRDFGFLENGGGPDIMVHKADLLNCHFLKPGVQVEFECYQDKQGLKAKSVKIIKENRQSPNNQGYPFGVMT